MSMLKQIHHGRRHTPPRLMIYGVEGVGKSTCAAEAPNPIFIPTEDGLDQIECASFPLATRLADVDAALKALIQEKHDFETWRLTHEYLCYEIMSKLLVYKWEVLPPEERAGFFSGLGSVPGKSQRYLADGYGIKDLIECYAPVAEKIPDKANEALWGIESLAEHHLRTLRREEKQRWKGRDDVPEALTRNIQGDWGGPGSARTPRVRVRQ